MEIGTVTDILPVRSAAPALEGARLVRVQTAHGAVAAADLAGARIGDGVLLATGEAAARAGMVPAADAAVVAVIGKND